MQSADPVVDCGSNWEEPAAGFVNLLMDRLTKVEADNTALRLRVTELEKTQLLHHHALDCTLHLVLDGRCLFSDGVKLSWHLQDHATTHELLGGCKMTQPLAGAHADATAFVGKYRVKLSPGYPPSQISMEEMTERTTVQQLVEAVNDMAAQYNVVNHYVDSISLKAPKLICIGIIPCFTV